MFLEFSGVDSVVNISDNTFYGNEGASHIALLFVQFSFMENVMGWLCW